MRPRRKRMKAVIPQLRVKVASELYGMLKTRWYIELNFQNSSLNWQMYGLTLERAKEVRRDLDAAISELPKLKQQHDDKKRADQNE